MAELIFNENTHQYFLNGNRLPSVTEICKPASVYVSENALPWMRDTAASKGTKIHQYCCDVDFNGGADGLQFHAECAGYVKAYTHFLRDYQTKSWFSELRVCSMKLGIAGTIDRVGILDGKLLILDIKTGTKIDIPLLTAQLTGYKHILLSGDCNIKIKEAYDDVSLWGLQLKKDGNYRIIKCGESSIFTILHNLFKERQKIISRNKGRKMLIPLYGLLEKGKC